MVAERLSSPGDVEAPSQAPQAVDVFRAPISFDRTAVCNVVTNTLLSQNDMAI